MQQRCCQFENVINQDPATSAIDATNDGSYAFYVRMADLRPGQSESFTWHYAAGKTSELANIAKNVAQAAAITKITVENNTIQLQNIDFVDINGTTLAKIKIESLPTNGSLTLNGTAVTVNQEIISADFDNLIYTPNADFFGQDRFSWQAFVDNAYINAPSSMDITVEEDTDNDGIGNNVDPDDDGDGVSDLVDDKCLDTPEGETVELISPKRDIACSATQICERDCPTDMDTHEYIYCVMKKAKKLMNEQRPYG